jgi:predicted ATP-grasp superfamily ATP-dependent carboligase
LADSSLKKEPVLVLDGDANTLSIVRCLSLRGIAVAVSTGSHSPALRSRFCGVKYAVPEGNDKKDYWADLLLSGKRSELKDSVLFVCGDEAIQFLCAHRDELARFHRFYDFDPKLHLALLDKLSTLELARSVGVAVPKFWTVNRIEDVERILPELIFPVIVKPLLSHVFRYQFDGRKYLRADNADQLLRQQKEVLDKGLKSMICDFIPGPDSLGRGYISFRNAEGQVLFQATSHLIRRYPKNQGTLCYYYTEWNPEVAELGRKLLQGIGFTGFSHIEFKFDPRDGQYKLIEVNPRFPALIETYRQSGIDIPYIIYCHLTDRSLPRIASFKNHVRMMNALDDFRAYLELSRLGELTLGQWLKSMSPRQNYVHLRLNDPWPAAHNVLLRFKSKMLKVASGA